MATISHSVLDGEFKTFPNAVESSSSSSASAISGSSTSPLADRLSSAFPSKGIIDVESLLPLFANQKLELPDGTYNCAQESKLEALGLIDRSYSGSVLGSAGANGIHAIHSLPEIARPFLSQKNGLNVINSSTVDLLNFDYAQSRSQMKQVLDYLPSIISDQLAGQERRCMTITERIQVPSSDHVAEIVGKNGQRIKQLREQLKVWVKTPSRDEPPIFEVTGLPEKLVEAKRIIQQMSDHFTKVQQERLARAEPNRMEGRLYVEQDKVGLIVGASGQTIRWVQHLSDTHIATPRKQESIPGLPPPQTYFTICGTKEKVKFAKQLICEYVTLRCQGLWLDPELESSAEASQLVREFHQRKQVSDTPRRTAVPSKSDGLLLSGLQGRPLVSTSLLASVEQEAEQRATHISEVKNLWTESGEDLGSTPPNRDIWNHVMFGDIGLGLSSERRYSADTPSPLPGMPPHSCFDMGQLRKSVSDEQVPVSGWM